MERNLIQIPLREGRTIHHDTLGKDGAGKIKLRSAPKGTGIIAGGPVRAVCEVLGIKDIVAKSLGTANPHNVIRACMKALSNQNSPKNISLIRNKKISEIIDSSKTILWNGPDGYFEAKEFSSGSNEIAKKIKDVQDVIASILLVDDLRIQKN